MRLRQRRPEDSRGGRDDQRWRPQGNNCRNSRQWWRTTDRLCRRHLRRIVRHLSKSFVRQAGLRHRPRRVRQAGVSRRRRSDQTGSGVEQSGRQHVAGQSKSGVSPTDIHACPRSLRWREETSDSVHQQQLPRGRDDDDDVSAQQRGRRCTAATGSWAAVATHETTSGRRGWSRSRRQQRLRDGRRKSQAQVARATCHCRSWCCYAVLRRMLAAFLLRLPHLTADRTDQHQTAALDLVLTALVDDFTNVSHDFELQCWPDCKYQVRCSLSYSGSVTATRRWIQSSTPSSIATFVEPSKSFCPGGDSTARIDNSSVGRISSNLRSVDSRPHSSLNKMQPETADLAPGAATWRTRRNIRFVFDSDPFAPLCETWRHSQNPKYITHFTAVRGVPSHGHR